MKRLAIIWSLGLFAVNAAEPTMSVEQRQKVIQLLKDSQREFIQLVQNLSDEQWSWKPAPDRWSVGEVAEHILLSEDGLFSKVQEAIAAPPNPDWQSKTAGKTELLEKVMAPRVGKAEAPEALKPQGKLSRTEIMKRFAVVRARTLRFAGETQAPLNDHTAEHPFAFFNTLSGYQWLLYIPLHNMRHDKQIQEVMAAAGFPK